MIRPIRAATAFIAVSFMATSAFAHSPLEATEPVNGAVVASVPTELFLDFKKDIRLTRVTMTHADSTSADMDLGDSKGFTDKFTIPLQDFGPGVYSFEWRGLGDDGHPMTDTFSFTVSE